MMPTILQLAQVGAHFGHRKGLTAPKAKRFIYSVSGNVSLIDLDKTVEQLRMAKGFFEEFKKSGRPALLIGTKRPLRTIIKVLGEKYALPYINERWYGGFLTNFDNFQTEIERYRQRASDIELSGQAASKKINKATRQRMINRLAKNDRFLGGVKELKSRPELVIVACGSQDSLAIKEAGRLGIPIIAITDTDINPDLLAYPIPANDDAPKAVEMILEALLAPPTISKTPTTAAKPKKSAQAAESKPVKGAKTVKKVPPVSPDSPDSPDSKEAKKSAKTSLKPAAKTKLVSQKPVAKKVSAAKGVK